MKTKQNNIAYIDGANLHRGVKELGWALDYKKLRVWLREKYGVSKAYLFLGFIPENANLYRDLNNWGYTTVLKPTVPGDNGTIKGNCDAELVLQAVSDMYENADHKTIIISGDGDFVCLVNFLRKKDRFLALISPNYHRASVLLRRAVSGNIIFLDEMKNKLAYIGKSKNEKAPGRDQPRT